MSDPAKYRSKDEVQEVRTERDSIDQARQRLLDDGVDEAEIKEIDKEIKAQIAEAVDFAQESPQPDPSELFADVLIETGGEPA